jgi:hypothetical protein
MPVIRVEYDSKVIDETEARAICEAVQKVVVEATGIEEVFVYGNSSHIKVNVAPIEIWVEMSAHKVRDADILAKQIRKGLSTWKNEVGFLHLINLTFTPVGWKLELEF